MQQQRWCQQPCHHARPLHFTVERIPLSTLMDTLTPTGCSSAISTAPYGGIIRGLKASALTKIQNGEDHRRQRSQRQDHRSQTDPKTLLHHLHPYRVHQRTEILRCNCPSTLWKIA